MSGSFPERYAREGKSPGNEVENGGSRGSVLLQKGGVSSVFKPSKRGGFCIFDLHIGGGS